MINLFYAGYKHYTTDVAVFDTEESREKWINDEEFVARCKLSVENVKDIIGDSRVTEIDADGILWLLNPINI